MGWPERRSSLAAERQQGCGKPYPSSKRVGCLRLGWLSLSAIPSPSLIRGVVIQCSSIPGVQLQGTSRSTVAAKTSRCSDPDRHALRLAAGKERYLYRTSPPGKIVVTRLTRPSPVR